MPNAFRLAMKVPTQDFEFLLLVPSISDKQGKGTLHRMRA
jgi:hypothetical protein